ncbi:hypothetical protein ACJ5H2_21985 (plasmid) [Nocardioides sp. R1-1]|uniref:hypothetical protein n=1 Tax=Nocardioides sp. R1-1 TaxID=3383502 RepID=UPI0038CF9337
MSARTRIQVDTLSRDGMTTIVEFLAVEPIADPELRDAVAHVLDEYIDAAATAGIHPGNARLLLLSELIQLSQDERAYERVATARGVLPL